MYSYLPRGQHHCPETTQPTTSPRRCPGLGGSAVLPLPPAQPRPLLVVCSHQSRAGGLGRRRGGGTCRRRLGPHAGQSTCACWGWNGLVPTRAAVGSRTFLSLPAWERGALASVPPLTRGLTLSWAGCGPRGRADRGRPRGLPRGAALRRQPSLSWPGPPRARGYPSRCPVPATGMHLRAKSRLGAAQEPDVGHGDVDGGGVGCPNCPSGPSALSAAWGEGKVDSEPCPPWTLHTV